MLAVGGCVSAIGQINVSPGGLNWDQHCIDPNQTNPFNAYSNDFATFLLQTPLWTGSAGISGTVAYKTCTGLAPQGGNVPVRGRIGFANGPQGSIQDDFRLQYGATDVNPDNGATFNYAMNSFPIFDPAGAIGVGATSGSGFSFADVVSQPITGGAWKQTFFGNAAFYEWFTGSSNRYFYIRGAQGTVDALLVMDIIGDASRCTWELTNNGTVAINLGLYFSQWTWISGGYPYNPGANYAGIEGNTTFRQGDAAPDFFPMGWFTPPPANGYQTYAAVPGQVPIQLETRYKNSATDPTQRVPAYVNFTGGLATSSADPLASPLIGPGFEVVNAPIQDVEDQNGQSDQTPVDEFVIGDPVNALAGVGDAVGNPTVRDVLVPDVEPVFMTYTQKWYPTRVNPGQTRTIVSYYRSIWGDSDYSNGYSVVVDTPKTISVNKVTPTNFNYPPLALTSSGVPFLPVRVNVDNTGAFGTVYKSVQMSNVKVTLQLGQGLYDANNPGNQTLISYIPTIAPVEMKFADFQITADPDVQGPVPYTVTVTPDVGVQKTITGFINLGATARLYLTQGANLVTSPWTSSTPTWQALLGLNPETDYQAFTWDASRGEYVIQTGPQRGYGTWIVSTANHGYLPLSGNPTTPADEFPPNTGLGTIQLQQGWNLVANPYNYSFPLGQLIGVAQGSSTVYTYDQLVLQGFFDGSFAYYDPTQQSYNFIQSDTARMLPNFGYWVYCQTPLTLQFPPIYDLFVRKAEEPRVFKQRYNNWRLQLGASQSGAADLFSYAGFTTNTAWNGLLVRKPPISPYKGALRAYLTNVGSSKGNGRGFAGSAGSQYQQLMHTAYGKQSYSYTVFTNQAGATSIRWPNLSQIPDNLKVTVTDTVTGQSVDARKQSGYSYYSQATTSRNFQVTITPEGTEREAIGSVSTPVRNMGAIRQMSIVFNATTRGAANIYVYKGSQQVGTIVTDTDIVAGQNVVKWSLLLSNGQLAPSGTYTLDIVATGEGGDTTSKLVNVRI